MNADKLREKAVSKGLISADEASMLFDVDAFKLIPLSNVREIISVSKNDIKTIQGAKVITLRGSIPPLVMLQSLFGLFDSDNNGNHNHKDKFVVVVVERSEGRIGLVVDAALEQQEIVVKPQDEHLQGAMGLGSCIGLALYDRNAKVGGIAHIMLPDGKGDGNTGKSCKFADRAVPVLLKEMLQHKARKERIVAKIAGGASMFSAMDTLQIGERNAIVVKEALKKDRIRPVAEDTGGKCARSVTLDTCGGEFISALSCCFAFSSRRAVVESPRF